MTAQEAVVDVGRGIELCYQQTGDPADPPIVLIAGLGQQLHSWPDDFVSALAGRGYRVTRFDNRDAGRSTHMNFPPPNPVAMFRGGDRPPPVPPRRYGAGHRRPARCARLPRCAPGRHLDGRDDRADGRSAPPRQSPHADVDHVHHRRKAPRPPCDINLAADADVAAAAEPGRGHGPGRDDVLPHRFSWIPVRRERGARSTRESRGTETRPQAASCASWQGSSPRATAPPSLRHIDVPTLVITRRPGPDGPSDRRHRNRRGDTRGPAGNHRRPRPRPAHRGLGPGHRPHHRPRQFGPRSPTTQFEEQA